MPPLPKAAGSAIRECTACGATSGVVLREGDRWQDTRCPYCQRPYGRPISLGLDRVADPSAPGWPSSDALERRRTEEWDKFIHPSKGK